MSKQAEIDYPKNLGKLRRGLCTKPFWHPVTDSAWYFRAFADIMQILELPSGAEVLDLGVGPGWTSILLAKLGYLVTAVDISPDMISIAQDRASRENVSVTFMVQDIEDLQLDKQFDAILIYDALHHCSDERRVLYSCFELLKSGGKMLISEPNWLHNFSSEAKKATREYGVIERGFTPRRLKKILLRFGFRKIRRFHCGRRAYSESLNGFLYMLRPPVDTLILSHFMTRVLLLAYKP